MSVTDVNGASDCHSAPPVGTLPAMATDRARDRRREETHQRLIDAGQRMFSERGFTETTTAEIALAAGVTERTFFRHFATKGDLVIAYWRDRAAALMEAVQDAPLVDEPLEVVRAGLHALAEQLVPDAIVFRGNVRTLV